MELSFTGKLLYFQLLMAKCCIAALAILGLVTAQAIAQEEKASVSGTVRYLQRRALPPDAVIHVQLQDVSLQGAKAKVLGEVKIPSKGKQVPFPFRISYSRSEIDPQHTYSVRATIMQGEKLLFSSTTANPVITRGAPNEVAVLVQPVPAAPSTSVLRLDGTDWRLKSLGGSAPPVNSKAALLFDAKGMRVSGSSGCNRLMGSYKLDGDSLHFEPAALTRMACPEPVMKLEHAFLEALRATTRYRIEGRNLHLLEGNRTLATFEAALEVGFGNWLGKWTGPEGTSLEIARKGNGFALTIQSLDGVETFEGSGKGDRILFTRAGKAESIRAGNGQETGMKWLLDKKNCLVVKSGEGYCRPE